MRPANVIARWPPQDGNEWSCQCARCGSSMARIECHSCGGEGVTAPGELHDLDPLWYDRDDEAPCFTCHGEAAWMVCVSQNYGEEEDSPGGDWCEANPLPGREAQRSAPEWFVTRFAAEAPREDSDGR